MGLINDNDYSAVLWNKNGKHRHYSKNILSFEFEEEDYDYLLFLKFENRLLDSILNIDALIMSLELIYNQNPTTFVILTPRKVPPLYAASEDEFVYSFSCNFQYFKRLASLFNTPSYLFTNILFELLDQISKDNSEFTGILIKQLPFEGDKVISVNSCNVVIPHRGDNEYLRNALSFLNHVDGTEIYVGIDQEVTENLLRLKKNYPNVSFYSFTPNPVGPYVIRNRLIDLSDNELVFFQDSDDIPCADRFVRISDYMKENGCQLCGSHELRLDYYDRTARSIRFPINVSRALETGPWHSLLHPASAITRKAFYDCGKLSEERTFGNDTKFLLSSFFILNNIRNVDEFFYIRKIHPGSLTTSPDTMIGSSIRKKLTRTWNSDFEEVRERGMKLENSSLKYEGSKLIFVVRKL
ncbi:hypothetical protein HDE69_004672 [Pedobacter cryoconitis]|uniref:Glycosyl transferase family 2 n=1 Tax=Pedobacter cryoconitis TaxID=188932 RepID=A0A7W9DLR3_9SPHI|nr:glycosyltransferase family A protein [Pedobacter cryoconitis]MBB5623586.1 hypothetical protein [Pedobacter cryoconitis]MBB5645414.1 hypothetical protein [Pedobacter cryoconitis]